MRHSSFEPCHVEITAVPKQYFFGFVYQQTTQELFYQGLESVCHLLKTYLEQLFLPLFLSQPSSSFVPSSISVEELVRHFLQEQPLTIKYYQRTPMIDSVVGFHIPQEWFHIIAKYLEINQHQKELQHLFLCCEPATNMCKYRFQGLYNLLDNAWKSMDGWAKQNHHIFSSSSSQGMPMDSFEFQRDEEWEMEPWNECLGYEKYVVWEGNSCDGNPRNFITEIYRPLLSS